ncbi:MAG TPA: NAD(P)-binding domain-containing protein [Bacteroidia bacterium]
MKKIAILGTGMVGSTIGSKMIELGHEVMMGSRTISNEKTKAWVAANGTNASKGTFADAAAFADLIFICTKGEVTLEMLRSANVNNFNGKTVIDISNPLDFSKGMPPILIPEYCNTNSLGEEVQKLLSKANVVKTLNIVNCLIMVDAKKSAGDPTMFVCGNNAAAKEEVTGILHQFGWNDIIDLGDISTARGTEMLMPIWLRTWMATGIGHFAFKVIK